MLVVSAKKLRIPTMPDVGIPFAQMFDSSIFLRAKIRHFSKYRNFFGKKLSECMCFSFFYITFATL